MQPGGGITNNSWNQLKADVLNRQVIVRKVREAGYHGAALLAQSAHLGTPVAKLIRDDQLGMNFISDPERTGIYMEKFKRYRQLFPALQFFALP